MRRLALALLLAAPVVAAGCGGDDDEPQQAQTATQNTQETTAAAEPPAKPAGRRLARSKGGPAVSTYASGLEIPWDIVFLPDGSALVTERPGRVRVLSPAGKLRGEPAARVPVSALGEGGLLGIALDPEFKRNRFVYLYYTTADGMKITRYRYRGGKLAEDATVLTGIQAGPIHDSGRIHFGPDKRLYVSTGDAGQDALAQQGDSRNGKFLRLSPAQYRGAGPARPEIFTTGHRNPQGFDWQPGTNRLVSTEHGPDGDDEVNVLRKGRNYGWPEARGRDHGGFTAPVAVYEDSIAPSGATFVSLPGSAWTGDFLFGALIGEQIRKLSFDGGRVTRNEALFEGEFGRVRTVVEGPDGALYALTSNRDGRGSPRGGDDRVLRIVPPAG
ncbi:MAG: PQQ-dependent sugar dehydrogenase [Thermoleophilaceae bacterium]|nr:PQQ-dependent sugar dehydrogenase [Thermoleophilaceae bacterium]